MNGTVLGAEVRMNSNATIEWAHRADYPCNCGEVVSLWTGVRRKYYLTSWGADYWHVEHGQYVLWEEAMILKGDSMLLAENVLNGIVSSLKAYFTPECGLWD